MSQWYWKVLALKAAFVFTFFATYIRADDYVQQLPFCNPHNANGDPVNNDLVIVSTLDGRLTAFTAENGNKAWDLETKPLLSSNLHHVELTSGGKWVRLVPSLRGTLFSLSGDTIEPLPFDAEQLLSASFKYSDDLVIAGARESFWLGVDASTGSVIYECGSSGCSSEQETAGDGKDIIVLRRHSNTVRAVDPRSGAEKWNFSVAEHNLALSRRECAGGSKGPSAPAVAVGVALPEGVVAVRRPGDSRILWRQKLDAPVAGMWRLQDGTLQNIDVLWEATQSLMEGPAPLTPPSLYIGVHDRQLYIQESILYTQKRDTAVSSKPLPWKVRHSRPLLDSNGQQTALSLQDADPNTLSLITLYGNTEPAGNHGFFLYLQETCDSSVQVTPEELGADIIQPYEGETHEHHHIHVHVSSLTYWWKEVLLIAATTALLTNLVWPRLRASTLEPPTALPVLQKESIVPETYYEVPSTPPQKTEEYSSRYLNDFTPIKCLGSGGFGVVFEARNKIDHCSYAVKRITLPRKEEKRTRVMREVRALATLEHDNIVRYFNSWVEEPPPNWQQKMDKLLLSDMSGHDILSSSQLTKTYKHDTKLDMHKCTESVNRRQRSNSYNVSNSVVDTQGLSDIKEPFNSDVSFPSHPKNNQDDDDSVVFFNSQYAEQSESRRESSHDKRLERVKDMHNLDSGTSNESPVRSKKKKGHRRHWSLDQCVIKNVTDKYLYIQMQLCLPESLDGWLKNHHTKESRGDVVKIFSQIVAAVEYVHLVGLIHRDLKPSNIFFAPDCRIKVGDFGLVTTMSDNSKDGDSPVVMDVSGPHTYKVGTHTYMSPEQLSGRPYNYKVDIYSLGLILYELLHPFATDMEKYKHLKEARSAVYPAKFCETHPMETEVLKLMLSEDPDRRPTAMGVKARAPLFQETDEQWHFTLPPSNILTDNLKNRMSVTT